MRASNSYLTSPFPPASSRVVERQKDGQAGDLGPWLCSSMTVLPEKYNFYLWASV